MRSWGRIAVSKKRKVEYLKGYIDYWVKSNCVSPGDPWNYFDIRKKILVRIQAARRLLNRLEVRDE